ncbi:MAG TPA: DUF2807 domain-containing protein [Candidatus Limnocylindria bacterium]
MRPADPDRRIRAAVSLSLLVLVGALAGCVQGQGPVTSESREVGAFSRIEASAGIGIVVHVGPSEAIEVSAQENLLPMIATDLRGDTLSIEASEDFTTLEPVTVTVVIPALDGITLSGGSQAVIDGLDAASLELRIRGGAQVTAAGSVGSVTLQADGGATANLEDLSVRVATVSIDGGATATLTASDEVAGTAAGGSRLTVLGDAVVSVEESGGSEVARGG